MPEFSARSKKNLGECDKRLQDIFNEVIQRYDCTIVCGYRGQEAQDEAFHNGYSLLKFPMSKHNTYPSLAVDVVPYPSMWDNEKEFYYLAGYVQAVADKLNVRIKWGGSFEKFSDFAHWQLI